ncbi:hypothetical protein [Arthrobacter sp. SLBN-112]|nr:hypothetical protein [Arthrobacter sp. SLBN-112]
MAQLQGFDALLVPAAPFHPTLAEVARWRNSAPAGTGRVHRRRVRL